MKVQRKLMSSRLRAFAPWRLDFMRSDGLLRTSCNRTWLEIVYCWRRQLPSAYCLLLSAFCFPPTAYCHLPTANAFAALRPSGRSQNKRRTSSCKGSICWASTTPRGRKRLFGRPSKCNRKWSLRTAAWVWHTLIVAGAIVHLTIRRAITGPVVRVSEAYRAQPTKPCEPLCRWLSPEGRFPQRARASGLHRRDFGLTGRDLRHHPPECGPSRRSRSLDADRATDRGARGGCHERLDLVDEPDFQVQPPGGGRTAEHRRDRLPHQYPGIERRRGGRSRRGGGRGIQRGGG